jgi:hypothetical protein
MNAIQLEFNIEDKTEESLKISLLQQQINVMKKTLDGSRKKLFSEIDALRKLCLTIQIKNEILEDKIRKLTNEKVEWVYAQEGRLFDVRESKESCG